MALLLNAGDTVSRSYSYTQPSPLHPSQPQGTGELETNLAIISGDSQTVKNFYYKDVRISDILEAGTYTVSYVIDEKTGNASSSTVGFGSRYAYQKDFKSFTVGNVPIAITATVTLETGDCLWARFLRAGSPTNFSYSVSHIRVEKGSHSYGYKIPISSANTTTPVYLGEVQTTRKVKKLVLTGNETILRDRERENSWRFFTDKLISAKGSTGICSHFENIGTNGVNNSDNIGFSIFNNAQFGCRCPKSIADTATDFKSYLAQQYAAGTPVTVWYVLAEPETAVVNEPLRKIGDYADEVSGITIPTITGKDTFDIQTTLKPSSVSLNYTGWHDAEAKEWDGSDWK